MGFRKEYFTTLTLDSEGVRQLQRINNTARRNGFQELDTSLLEASLSVLSTGLSIVAVGCTATSLAVTGAIVAVVSALLQGEKEVIDTVLLNGEDSLFDIYNGMLDHGATKAEFEAPMLEFVDEGIRFVQGNCTMKRVLINGRWTIL